MNFAFRSKNYFSGSFYKNCFKGKQIFNMFNCSSNSSRQMINFHNKYYSQKIVTSNFSFKSFNLLTGEYDAIMASEDDTNMQSPIADANIMLNEFLISSVGNI